MNSTGRFYGQDYWPLIIQPTMSKRWWQHWPPPMA